MTDTADTAATDKLWPSGWFVACLGLLAALVLQRATQMLMLHTTAKANADGADDADLTQGIRIRQAMRLSTLVACGVFFGGLVTAASPALMQHHAGHWITAAVFTLYMLGLLITWHYFTSINRSSSGRPSAAWDLKSNRMKPSPADPTVCQPCGPRSSPLDSDPLPATGTSLPTAMATFSTASRAKRRFREPRLPPPT